MAPKPPSPLENPPAASKSDQVASSGSGSESEASEPQTVKPQSESEPDGGNGRVPIASMPMEEVPSVISGAKRPPGGEGELNKDSKKSKLFQKIWSDEDEITVLKGMHEYATKGLDPHADMGAFYEFIKKSLNMDVSKVQMKDKIWRLRNKFLKNEGKKHKPTKPHDSNIFDLSKKVWGGGEDVADQEPEAKSNPAEKIGAYEDIGFDKGFKQLGLSETILRQGLQLIGEAKYADLKNQWSDQHVAQLELCVRRTELISYQAKMILEALKSDH